LPADSSAAIPADSKNLYKKFAAALPQAYIDGRCAVRRSWATGFVRLPSSARPSRNSFVRVRFMTTFKRWIAGGCLFAVGLIGSVGRADYISSDNRLPSPQYRSTNTVLYNTPHGPFAIDSFFDVFVEIDRVPPPPPGGTFVDSFFDVFTELTLHPPSGPPTTVNPIPPNPQIRLSGGPPGNPYIIDTEMLSMNLVGGTMLPGIMIRESPTLPSIGKTSIQDLGGGQYHIDSFFDVFTELSLDGGATWSPGNQPLHLDGGLPEPTSAVVALLIIATVSCAGLRGKMLP
jgi:hypothetical protein